MTATQTSYITAPTIPTLAQPGTISATFSTVGATGATGTTGSSDQFSIQNTGLAQPRVFGTDSTATNNTFAATVSSGATVYPTATPLTTAYTAEAGGCVDPNVPTAGQVPVTVTSNQISTPTLPEPALIILPYTSPPEPPRTPGPRIDNTLPDLERDDRGTRATPGAPGRRCPAATTTAAPRATSSTTNSTVNVAVTFTGNSIQVWLG